MNLFRAAAVATALDKIWGKRPETGGARGSRGAARFRRLRLILEVSAIALLAGSAAAMATDISACGSTVTKPGFYEVTQDLTASSGDCIDVNAPHAILFLNGHQISGSGSGIGIHFTSRANHSFVEGGNANISGFGIGVEDDAPFVHGDNFNADGNGTGGLLVNGAQNSTFSNFQASNNATYGVRFLMASSAVAESAQASNNGNYGIWLDGASGVRIDNFDTEQNASAGVYVGCSSSGPGSTCSGAKHNNIANQIYDGFADGNGPYGVAIDANATDNIVTAVESMNNKSADLIDFGKCGTSSWFGNAFASATPNGCIN
jgi:hypothetical protein